MSATAEGDANRSLSLASRLSEYKGLLNKYTNTPGNRRSSYLRHRVRVLQHAIRILETAVKRRSHSTDEYDSILRQLSAMDIR